MRIDSAIITGSFSVNGDTFNDLGAYTTTGSNTFIGNQSIVGAVSASALTGSISYTNLTDVPTLVSGSSQIVSILSPLNSFTASNSTTNTFTSSATARLNALESTSASVDTLNNTQNTRLANLENKTGSLATTGSNIFYGNQTISGTVYIQSDLIVQGSSCIQNITGSSLNIGTNIVSLNTATPSVRYAGLTVQDSGSSAGVTGSMLWDSLCNRWIYSNPSTVGYSGGMLLSGPRASTLGTETTLTCNYVAKSGGGDHLYDSCIIDDGTTTCIKNNLVGTGTACFTGAVCSNYVYSSTSIVAGGTLWTGDSIRKLSDNQCIFFRNAAGTVEATISGDGGATFTRRVTAQNISITSDSSEQITVTTASDSNKQLIFGRTATEARIIAVTQNVGYVPLSLQPNGGNIGIGCLTPSYLLDVNGTARILSTLITNDSLLIGTTSTATGAKIYACNNAAVIFRAESTEDQAGLRLVAGCTSLNRASRIDFLNGATSRTTPQWTIINDYNQNGTNDLSIVNCDTANRPFKMFQSGIACFSNTICSGGTFISNLGATTSTYGFTHCGAGYYGRFGVPNSSYMYLETNTAGGVYIDAATRTNCLAVNTAWSSGGGAYQPLQIKAGLNNSGVWVESCSVDSGFYINMAGTCAVLGQSYRTSGGYGDIIIQTSGNNRMRIKCEGNVEVQTGIISPMFMIERNSPYNDLSAGSYLNLMDSGTNGLNAKFQQQFAPFTNSGESMTWNYGRMIIRITGYDGSFYGGYVGCIRNASYFYSTGWYCFGNHVQIGTTLDGGRGFRWVVMPWFSYNDFSNGTDVPGLGIYNQNSDIAIRIGGVYLQYKA